MHSVVLQECASIVFMDLGIRSRIGMLRKDQCFKTAIHAWSRWVVVKMLSMDDEIIGIVAIRQNNSIARVISSWEGAVVDMIDLRHPKRIMLSMAGHSSREVSLNKHHYRHSNKDGVIEGLLSLLSRFRN